MCFTACVSTKKTVYFDDLQDTTLQNKYAIPEPLIQQGDILSITVTSLNTEASIIFNTPNISNVSASTTGGGTVNQASGYLVDFKGNIQFPVLGNVHVVGLTDEELKDTITNELSQRKLLIDPIVIIRHLNFKVTVLGEVMHPTVVNVNSDKISILEAIGMAGDLTIYGKRDNVLLIREEHGEKVVRRIDLNSPDLLTSKYYYLKTNDVIYVEPNKTKINTAGSSRQLLPVILSALSFITIIVDRLIIK